MPSVKVRENEPFEFALRRFKRTCEKAGVLAEMRKREFYEKPTAERKRKLAAAVKRHSQAPAQPASCRRSCTRSAARCTFRRQAELAGFHAVIRLIRRSIA